MLFINMNVYRIKWTSQCKKVSICQWSFRSFQIVFFFIFFFGIFGVLLIFLIVLSGGGGGGRGREGGLKRNERSPLLLSLLSSIK